MDDSARRDLVTLGRSRERQNEGTPGNQDPSPRKPDAPGALARGSPTAGAPGFMLALVGSWLRAFRADRGAERWAKWTEWPLIVLALIFLVVLILPLAHPITATESHAL